MTTNVNPWDATSAVSIDLAQSLIEEQFPDIKVNGITFIGEGWDNKAFLINDAFVFRFPRRAEGVECLQNELNLLPFLNNKNLGVLITNPIFIGRPSELYPYVFAGYQKIEGDTGCSQIYSDADRIKNIPLLAHFLRQLHAVPIEEAQQFGAGLDGREAFDIPKKSLVIIENLKKLKELQLISEIDIFKTYLSNIQNIQNSDLLLLVHGDFYSRHLILNESNEVTGVIDWGDIGLCHPAIDLAITYTFLPVTSHVQFEQEYGPISQNTWELARFRALYSASLTSMYGASIQDQNLVSVGLWGLENIRNSL